MHTITKNHKCESPSKILFFDSESYVDTRITDEEIQRKLNNNKESIEKEHTLYLICSTYLNLKKVKEKEELKDFYVEKTELNFEKISDAEKEIYTDNDDELENIKGNEITKNFWEYVDSKVKDKEKILVLAHNAKYDIIQTNCVRELINLNYKVRDFADSNPFIMNFTQGHCKHCKSYNVLFDDEADVSFCEDCNRTLSKKEITKKSISILSSTNFYQTSLKVLGDCFGIKKLDFEYEQNKQTFDEELKYCRQDVLILKTAMLAFINFVKVEDLGNFKQTIAGQSFNAYRHRFMNTEIVIHREKQALITERLAYSGGRTEMWKCGEYKNLYYVDINSMYPSIMITEKMPTRLLTFRKIMTIPELKDWIKRGYLITCKCDLITDENIYMKKEERLIFPKGEFTTYLNTPEVKHALKNNHLKKVTNVCIYEGNIIFKEYVEYFYNKRLEAKSKGDEVHSYIYKLFLNSLYGKFGQVNKSWEKIADAPVEECHSGYVMEITENGTETFLQKTFGGGTFRETKLPLGESESYNSFPSIAGHVTSYSRMLLWEYAEITGKENVYYMDTDSLFTNEEGYNNLIKNNCIDSNILGKMKLECKCESAEFRGVKDYTFYYRNKENELVKKNTIKGISKNSIKIDDNTYACLKWEGMANYIKNGEINNYKNKLMIKKLKRDYKKGIILENGNVNPFNYAKNERVI